MIYKDIKVTYPEGMSEEEIKIIVDEEISIWKLERKEIAEIVMELDGDEVIVKSNEKSPVIRVRRITGYASKVENFNDAKRSELESRYKHVK